MDLLKIILDIAERTITILVLVGGVVGFLCRTWISEWIKNRFSRAVGQELETHKHKLNRELEAYRGSLLRELEQFRANLDIKRSIALKYAEARLDALRLLAAELDRFINECVSTPTVTRDLRQRNLGEFNRATEAMRQAFRSAEIFIPLELAVEISQINVDASQMANEYFHSDAVIQHDDERIKKVSKSYAKIANKLRDQIHANPTELA